MLWLLLDRLEVLVREVLGAPDLSARAAPERHRMPTATTAMMFFIRPLGASWDAPCARSIARLPTTYEGLRSLINNSNVRRQVNLSLTRPTGGIIERTRRRGSHIGLHVTEDTRLSSWNYWTVRRPRREERRAAGGATCGVSPIVPHPVVSRRGREHQIDARGKVRPAHQGGTVDPSPASAFSQLFPCRHHHQLQGIGRASGR